jgi:hypothetical protein
MFTNTFKKIRNFFTNIGSDPRRMTFVFGALIVVIIILTVILSLSNAGPKNGDGVTITKNDDGTTIVNVTNKDLAKLSNTEIKKKLGISGDKVIIFVPAALRPRHTELEPTPTEVPGDIGPVGD